MSALNKIRKHSHGLHVLCDKNFPTSAKKALLKEGAEDFINSIAEICLNLIAGNIPLSGKSLKRLKTRKRDIYYLASPQKANSAKRKYILRKGKLDQFAPVLSTALEAVSARFGEQPATSLINPIEIQKENDEKQQ